MTLMIETRQLEKSFGKNRALRGIDLTVGENQVTGLLRRTARARPP